MEDTFLDLSIACIIINFIFFALSLAASICACVAVVNDCKANGNTKGTMWGILVFFFPLIVGVIYLCIRNSGAVNKFCTNCGKPLKNEMVMCDNCGSTAIAPVPETPERTVAKRKSKNCLIAFIVLWVLGIVISIVFLAVSVVIFARTAYDEVTDGGSSFEDFYDDFENDFDYDTYDDTEDLI